MFWISFCWSSALCDCCSWVISACNHEKVMNGMKLIQHSLSVYPHTSILPELAPTECSFVVFPHPFDKALLHVYHQLPVRCVN